jgi:hypothetical protein
VAEIRVEKKKTNIWPWIIGLILLALVAWGITQAMDNDRDDTVNTAPQTGAAIYLNTLDVRAA